MARMSPGPLKEVPSQLTCRSASGPVAAISELPHFVFSSAKLALGDEWKTPRCSWFVLERSHKMADCNCRCDVRNYWPFHGVYQSGIMGCWRAGYAIDRRVFWLRVGVSDSQTGFTNGLYDS